MNYWFTADCHFSHFNIIRYCNRPFKTLDEMHSVLIRNWNERVKHDDIVFHIGDFGFTRSKEAPDAPMRHKDVQDMLNGHIIYFKGSHDNNNKIKTCILNMVIQLGGYEINLVHDPKYAKVNYAINLVAHVHTAYLTKELVYNNQKSLLINVGCDLWNFKPINISEILQVYGKYKKHGI